MEEKVKSTTIGVKRPENHKHSIKNLLQAGF
jgi:hypothetical protein